MKELERSGDSNDRFELAISVRDQRIEVGLAILNRLPAPVAEQGSESLATPEKIPGEIGKRGNLTGYGGENWTAIVEEPVDARLNKIY